MNTVRFFDENGDSQVPVVDMVALWCLWTGYWDLPEADQQDWRSERYPLDSRYAELDFLTFMARCLGDRMAWRLERDTQFLSRNGDLLTLAQGELALTPGALAAWDALDSDARRRCFGAVCTRCLPALLAMGNTLD